MSQHSIRGTLWTWMPVTLLMIVQRRIMSHPVMPVTLFWIVQRSTIVPWPVCEAMPIGLLLKMQLVNVFWPAESAPMTPLLENVHPVGLLRFQVQPRDQAFAGQHGEHVVAVGALRGGLVDFQCVLKAKQFRHARAVPQQRVERRQHHPCSVVNRCGAQPLRQRQVRGPVEADPALAATRERRAGGGACARHAWL